MGVKSLEPSIHKIPGWGLLFFELSLPGDTKVGNGLDGHSD